MPIEGLLPSNCDVNVFGLKVSTYCNLLEKIFLSQFRDALKQSLPLSSPRAMRQIEVKYVELQTMVREDFTLMEKDQTMADTKVIMKRHVVWLAYPFSRVY